MATIPGKRSTLPDRTSLGVDPPSAPTRHVVGVEKGVAEQGEIAGAQAEMSAAEGLQPVADSLARASAAIQDQNDAMTRIAGIRDYRAKAEAETNRLLASGALHDPATMEAYGKFLADLEQQTTTRYGGKSPQSRVAMSGQIAQMGMGYTSNLAQVATKAQQDMLKEELSRELMPLTLQVADNPGSFLESMVRYEQIVDQMPGSPEFRTSQKKAAMGIFAEAAINKMLMSGQLANIPGAMNDVMDVIRHPQVAAALGPDKFNSFYMKVLGAQKGTQEDVKGIPRDIWNRMSPADQQKALVGGGVHVNVTPDQTYAGAEAKALAGSSVKMAEKDQEAGQRAQSDLTQIQQMRAAIDSGQFRTGALGETRQTVGRYLEFFGAPPELIQAIGDPKQADVMDSAAAWLATNAAQKISRSTNLSLQLIQDSLPKLTKTMEGNRILLDIMERTAKRDIEIDNLRETYLAEYGTLRPKGRKSYDRAKADLQANSPVVDEELRQKIMAASAAGQGVSEAEKLAKAAVGAAKGAAKTAKGAVTQQAPAGLTMPQGFEYVGTQDGFAVIRNPTTGETRRKRMGTPQ